MSRLPGGPSLGGPSPGGESLSSPGRHVSFSAIHDVMTRHGHGVLARHPMNVERSAPGEPHSIQVGASKDAPGPLVKLGDNANPIYEALHQESARLWQEHVKRNPEQVGHEHFSKLAAAVAAQHFPRHELTNYALADFGALGEEPGYLTQHDALQRAAGQANWERVLAHSPEMRDLAAVAHGNADATHLAGEGLRSAIGDVEFPNAVSHRMREELPRFANPGMGEHDDPHEALGHLGAALARKEFHDARALVPDLQPLFDEAQRQPTNAGYAHKLLLAGEALMERGHPEGERLLELGYKIAPELKEKYGTNFSRQLAALAFFARIPVLENAQPPSEVDWRTHQPAVRGPGLPLPEMMTQGLKRPIKPRVLDYRKSPPGQRIPFVRPADIPYAQVSEQQNLPRQPLVEHPGGTRSSLGAMEVPHRGSRLVGRRLLGQGDLTRQALVEHGGGTLSSLGAYETLRAGQRKPEQQVLPEKPKRALSIAGMAAKRAKEMGLNPAALPGLAKQLRDVDRAAKDEHNEMLSRARDMMQSKAHVDKFGEHNVRSEKYEDVDAIPGFDLVAAEIGSQYPHILGTQDVNEGGSAVEEKLLEHMKAGNRKYMTHEESYEEALRYMDELRHEAHRSPDRPREPGEDEGDDVVPFARRGAALFMRDSPNTVDEEMYRCICALIPSTKPGVVPFTLGCVDGNEVCVADFDVYKVEYDMDTVEGANDLETDWPRKVFGPHYLLVDVNLALHEWAWVLYHEAHERRLMSEGMDYNTAHEHANNCERQLRLRGSRRSFMPAHFDRTRNGFASRLLTRT